LEDLGSTNGTYLNRQKVSSATTLRTGDHLQIGSTVFEAMS
jgi:pSer/pThr/pTyr-binding forkhead associated (FHA) protein